MDDPFIWVRAIHFAATILVAGTLVWRVHRRTGIPESGSQHQARRGRHRERSRSTEMACMALLDRCVDIRRCMAFVRGRANGRSAVGGCLRRYGFENRHDPDRLWACLACSSGAGGTCCNLPPFDQPSDDRALLEHGFDGQSHRGACRNLGVVRTCGGRNRPLWHSAARVRHTAPLGRRGVARRPAAACSNAAGDGARVRAFVGGFRRSGREIFDSRHRGRRHAAGHGPYQRLDAVGMWPLWSARITGECFA